MLVAILNAELDAEEALEPFLRETHRMLEQLPGTCDKTDAQAHARVSWGLLHERRYYDCCVSALKARACVVGETAIDHVEIVGRLLCRTIRGIYPLAPSGFERVGRMKGMH